EFGPHGVDDLLVVGLAENGRAGNEGVSPGAGDFADIVDFDAAIDFQHDVASGFIDHFADFGNLFQRAGNEGLTTETGVHRHQQDDVELVHHMLQIKQRCGRIEYQA